MPLTELLPLLKELSYTDKLQLLHLLSTELLKDAGLALSKAQEGVSMPNLSDSFEAAAVLAKALAEEQSVKHD